MFGRVVITGLGTINPLGRSCPEFFRNIDNGVSGAELITEFDTTAFKTRFACPVKDFDPETFGIDPKAAKRYDRSTLFGLVATEEAIKDSSLDLETEDMRRIGVVIGSGIGGIQSFTQEVTGFVEGGYIPRHSPLLTTRVVTDTTSGVVSIRYGFRGPNYSVSSACATSIHAIICACQQIQLGKADVVITGGTEAPISTASVGSFGNARALSTNNDSYKTASRPFDATRDGFVLGEGAGILILESYEHAIARGARIYAEIAGYGSTADAYHITAPHPEGRGAAEAMRDALDDAGLSTSEIDYINVHGTSTQLGDVPELNAIRRVFGEDALRLNISSTKSMTGHLLGAAGAVESLVCIHAMNAGIVPPTINFTTPDPKIDPALNLTVNKAQKREIRCSMNNGFGFAGHNGCLIFRKMN